MLQTLINFFKKKSTPVIPLKPKTVLDDLLKKCKYKTGQDLIVIPQQLFLPYEFEMEDHLILRIKFLHYPAIIKS